MKEKTLKPNRICIHRGCTRGCTFGRVFGWPEYCKAHIPLLLEPTGDFEKIPFVEVDNDEKTVVSYKLKPVMEEITDNSYFDCKNKRCEHNGCNIRACYDYPIITDQKTMRGTFCSKHKEEGMIDVTHQKCSGFTLINNKKCKCMKQPHFGFPTDISPQFCGEHKKKGMIDIKHYFCIKCKEYKEKPSRATWQWEGRTGAISCTLHKEDGMIEKYPYKSSYDNKKRERKQLKKQEISLQQQIQILSVGDNNKEKLEEYKKQEESVKQRLKELSI